MTSRQTVRAMVVDDGRATDDGLRFLLSSHEHVELVAESSSVSEALALANALNPHVAFVEWRVQGELGLTLAPKFRETGLETRVVIATAFERGALQAFEAGVLDYILRPAQLGRLERTLTRVKKATRPPHPFSRLAVRHRGQYVVIDLADVTHFEAKDKFVIAHSAAKEWALDLSLSHLERRLRTQRFFRCHRRALVRLSSIDRVVAASRGRYRILLKEPHSPWVPVARQRMGALLARIGAR